jgi:DNA-binding CsgD family transcriptional regulator
LSVFKGGYTQSAVQELANASFEIMGSLVDKSFVQVNETGRYDLHEVVRQFALRKLKEHGELKNALDSHSSYFAHFIVSRIPDMKGRRQIPAIKEIDLEFENIKAAWAWCMANAYEQLLDEMLDGIDLFASLQYRHLEVRTLYADAIAELENKTDYRQGRLWRRLVIRVADENEIVSKIEWVQGLAQQEDDLYEVAYCLSLRGSVAYTLRQYDGAIELWDKSIELYRQLGDKYNLAQVLTTRMTGEQRWEYIKSFRDEILQLRRDIGDRMGIAGLPIIAFSAGREGRFAESEALWLEKIAIGQDIGNLAWVVSGYTHLSYSVYFFSGDFIRARENATKAIEIAQRITYTTWVTYWAKTTLGLLETMDENYEEATRLFEKSTRNGLHRDIKHLSAWGLSLVSCGLSKFDAALKYLVETYHLYLKMLLGEVGQVSTLPIISLIISDQGQTIRAVELFAFAMTHSVGVSGWMEKWAVLNRAQQEWQAKLGAEVFSAAWNRGQQFELDNVMREIEAQYLAHSSEDLAPVNKGLIEALSPRELEVLVSIAEGLTNREIADRLFIGVSTVKKHIQHIYAKLEVKTRTKAILRARELSIIA